MLSQFAGITYIVLDIGASTRRQLNRAANAQKSLKVPSQPRASARSPSNIVTCIMSCLERRPPDPSPPTSAYRPHRRIRKRPAISLRCLAQSNIQQRLSAIRTTRQRTIRKPLHLTLMNQPVPPTKQLFWEAPEAAKIIFQMISRCVEGATEDMLVLTPY